MNKQTLLVLIVGIILAVGVGFVLMPKKKEIVEVPLISNFEECAAAGYSIMESYPMQCRTASGELFVQIEPAGIGPGEEKLVMVKSFEATTVNFDIDTSIR